MKISELAQVLNDECFPEYSYCLHGGLPNDMFCIEYNEGSWDVYYSERGNKTDLKKYGIEDDACQDLLARLIRLKKYL